MAGVDVVIGVLSKDECLVKNFGAPLPRRNVVLSKQRH